MKPIRLEFAGLQSYREPQVIDFADLLGGGLFGIFGPTGAGKSTVLDAITLALYGRVGRADRGTFGIINQNENRLYVKFAFALGQDGLYRVERSYRREKETESVRSEHCRLIEVADGLEKVMADKERDVNDQVAEILGLKLEDFTRAVVLPQGQFAEFLHLGGKDRTQMLQRIFSLTQYGDRLTQRLKKRTDAIDSQLIGVLAERTGLGDASAEAVTRAEELLRVASSQVMEAEKVLDGLQTEFRVWEKVRDLQLELATVDDGIARWQAGSADAGSWRLELAGARRAEQVRPYLDGERQARRQVEQATAGLGQAEDFLVQAREAAAKAVLVYETARTRKAQELPKLTERRVQLEQAVALEPALDRARKLVSNLSDRVEAETKLTREIAEGITADETRLQEMAERESSLRRRLSDVDVDTGHRSRIQEASRLLDRLREARRVQQEIEHRLNKRKQQLETTRREAERTQSELDGVRARLAVREQELQRLEAEPPADEAEIRSQESWLSRAEEQIRTVRDGSDQVDRLAEEQGRRRTEALRLAGEQKVATDRELAERRALDQCRKDQKVAQALLDEAWRNEHAVALFESLSPGEPCPVCGATEHPLPATPETPVDLAAATATQERAEQAVQRAEDALEKAIRGLVEATGGAAAAGSRVQESQEAIAQAQARLTEAHSRLPETWRELAPEALLKALEKEQVEQTVRKQRYQLWQTSLKEMREQRGELSEASATASAEASSRAATNTSAEQSVAEGEREVTDRTALVGERQAELDGARGDFDSASIEGEQRRIQEADREAATLRQTMETLRQARQAIDMALTDNRQKHERYMEALQSRKLEHAQAQQSLAEGQSRWQTLAGGQPARGQLTVVEQTLRQLEQDEAGATSARELAEQARGGAEALEAAARRESELAAEQFAGSETALAAALQTADFPSPEAARAALSTPSRQAELGQAIGEYERQGDRLQNQQKMLNEQLAGRSLTEDAWAGWQQLRDGALTTVAERRDERAKAQQIWDDICAKQARWQELEAQQRTLTTVHNHLDDLRALLRGNAFVDFLAQDQMVRVAADASLRLGQITRSRYALQTEGGGGFLIRDDGNGGTCRAITTLSGGETFLTSLALALSLSAQIQLRGRYPLEFFFLDEGFGTLDPELLDVVISTLERLHFENLHVGVISHVPELRSRLQRRVIVEPAELGGRGSRLHLEQA